MKKINLEYAILDQDWGVQELDNCIRLLIDVKLNWDKMDLEPEVKNAFPYFHLIVDLYPNGYINYEMYHHFSNLKFKRFSLYSCCGQKDGMVCSFFNQYAAEVFCEVLKKEEKIKHFFTWHLSNNKKSVNQ